MLCHNMDEELIDLARAVLHPREDLRSSRVGLSLSHCSGSKQVRTLPGSVRCGCSVVTPVGEDEAGIRSLCERKHLAERVYFVGRVSAVKCAPDDTDKHLPLDQAYP